MLSILKSSKFLIFSVCSLSVILATYGNRLNFEAVDLTAAPTQENAIVQRVSYDSIWNSLRDEFVLDDKTESKEVKLEIRRLLADQGKLVSILKAAGPYIYFIHNQTKARGLPAEIALIPVIESEFNPFDHSKKGAAGLWQLMPQTAQELGIKIKSHYDGRRNIVASTKAALAYFNDLGKDFKGDWYLAIAAYNCGQVKVQSLEHRTGKHSFWKLPLPQETKEYVPKLLAVAAIIKNPKKYGVQLPPVDNRPYFKEVNIQQKHVTDLGKVAKSSGVSVQTLQLLNPDFKREITTNNKGNCTLLVPVNANTKVS